MKLRTIIFVLVLVLAPFTSIAESSMYWINEDVVVTFADEGENVTEEVTAKLNEPMDEDYVELKCLGYFDITSYCGCSYCTCGLGLTASGTAPIEGRTISVDPEIIPLGSKVWIDGLGEFIAEDTGSAIHGNIIDLYLADHNRAINFGRQYMKVYIEVN